MATNIIMSKECENIRIIILTVHLFQNGDGWEMINFRWKMKGKEGFG